MMPTEKNNKNCLEMDTNWGKKERQAKKTTKWRTEELVHIGLRMHA